MWRRKIEFFYVRVNRTRVNVNVIYVKKSKCVGVTFLYLIEKSNKINTKKRKIEINMFK